MLRSVAASIARGPPFAVLLCQADPCWTLLYVSTAHSIAPKGNNWRNCIDRCTYWDEKTTEKMGKVDVPTTSVERLLAEHPDIHMVKIDIEGAEMELLETVEWPQHVRYLAFEYSIGTRSCTNKCAGSIAKGCTPECAKVRFPMVREKLESQVRTHKQQHTRETPTAGILLPALRWIIHLACRWTRRVLGIPTCCVMCCCGANTGLPRAVCTFVVGCGARPEARSL
jgi:hypothetical protein